MQSPPAQPYKFGHLDSSGNETSFEYPDCWAVEKTTGPDRLVIAPASRQVELMLRLTTVMREPFGLLYVLLIPRAGGNAGRYQSPSPVSSAKLAEFIWEFQELFEKDARQHLWISSADNSSLLVYDNHNVIYAYGPLGDFEGILSSVGLSKCTEIRFPSPHTHRYNFKFDDQERFILKYWEWIYSPLQESDDL